MKKIRVVLWGMGAMGRGIASALLERPNYEIVGVISSSSRGRSLAEIIGDGNSTVVATARPEALLQPGLADAVIISTASFTHEVAPQIKQAVQAGMHVVTIAEEMAYPAAQSPDLARELDQLAREQGVAILGTGINPGFVLDSLIIALTRVCLDIKSIHAIRVNDLSPFGPAVMRTQGVGTTVAEFEAGLAAGTIVGHVGFPESIQMIAEALGWELDEIVQTQEPIVSSVYRETPHVKVQPGMVAGCRHIAYGKKNGKILITLEHPQQVRPELENVNTGDFIHIAGTPEINLAIRPEIPGGIGTIAMAVNMLPLLCVASPGLKTMLDLPILKGV